MINACPNLRVLKIESETREMSADLLELVILNCKKLEILTFKIRNCREPVPINHLYFKITFNLENLKLLYLPEFYLSDLNVKCVLTNNRIKFIKVQNRFYVNSDATSSDLLNYLEHETSNFEETEIV